MNLVTPGLGEAPLGQPRPGWLRSCIATRADGQLRPDKLLWSYPDNTLNLVASPMPAFTRAIFNHSLFSEVEPVHQWVSVLQES